MTIQVPPIISWVILMQETYFLDAGQIKIVSDIAAGAMTLMQLID